MDVPSGDQWDRVDELIDEIEDLPKEKVKEQIDQLSISGEDPIVVKYLRTHFRLPKDPGLQPGQKLVNRYTILSRLGEGGMGVVFRAQQHAPEREVAIKVVHPSFAISKSFADRFTNEINNLGQLNHPGIVQIYEADKQVESSGKKVTPFYTMELVEGIPIHKYCKQNECGHRAIIDLFLALCEAIQHAHDRGVIHGDLKPQNILVRENGQPTVLDFGLSQITSELIRGRKSSGSHSREGVTETDTRSLGGTPSYMSPEQVSGNIGRFGKGYGIDIYALGVILFELLADRLPIQFSKDASMDEISRDILSKAPPPLWSVSNCDKELSYIVGKALRKEANRRYLSAASLRRALELYRNERFGWWGQSRGWNPRKEAAIPGTGWVLRKRTWPPEEGIYDWTLEERWIATHADLELEREFRFFMEELVAQRIKNDDHGKIALGNPFEENGPVQPILQASLDDPPFYLQQAPIHGEPLPNWLETHGGIARIPEAVKLDIMAQLAMAVQICHRAGIVHGGLSPACVYVRGDPWNDRDSIRVTLTDYVIRRIVSGIEREIAKQGFQIGGDRAFDAPEIREGDSPTPASDVYALGVLYYKLIVDDFGAILPDSVHEKCPDDLIAEDITGCVAALPDMRTSSAGALAHNIQQIPRRRDDRWIAQAERARLSRAAFRRGLAAMGGFALAIISIITFFGLSAVKNAGLARLKAAEAARETEYAGQRTNSLEAIDKISGLFISRQDLTQAKIESLNLIDIREVGATTPKEWRDRVAESVVSPDFSRIAYASPTGRLMVANVNEDAALFDWNDSSLMFPAKLVFSQDARYLGAVFEKSEGYEVVVFELESNAEVFRTCIEESVEPTLAIQGGDATRASRIAYSQEYGDVCIVELGHASKRWFRVARPFAQARIVELLFHPESPLLVARFDGNTTATHCWRLQGLNNAETNVSMAIDAAAPTSFARGIFTIHEFVRACKPDNISYVMHHNSLPISMAWTEDDDGNLGVLDVICENGNRRRWALFDSALGQEPFRRPTPSLRGSGWIAGFWNAVFSNHERPSFEQIDGSAERRISVAAISADKKREVGMLSGNRLRMVEKSLGQQIDINAEQESAYRRLFYSKDGARIGSEVSGGVANVWEIETGDDRIALEPLPFEAPIEDIEFWGSDRFVAVISGPVVSFYDAVTGKRLEMVDRMFISDLYRLDSSRMLTAGANGVWRWSRERVHGTRENVSVEGVLCAPSKTRAVTYSRYTEEVFAAHYQEIIALPSLYFEPSPEKGHLDKLHSFKVNDDPIDRIVTNGSGEWMAVGSVSTPGEVRIVDLKEWKDKRESLEGEGRSRIGYQPPENPDALDTHVRPEVRFANLKPILFASSVVSGDPKHFEFDPLRSLLVSGINGRLRAYNPEDGKESVLTRKRRIPSRGALAFSRDGELLAVGNGRDGVTLYQWPSLERIVRIPSGELSALRFSPKGRWLVLGYPDGRAIVWDLSAVDTLRGKMEMVAEESKPLDVRFEINAVLDKEYIDSVTELLRLTRTNLGANQQDVNFGNIAVNYLILGEHNAAAEMARESLEVEPYNNAIRHLNLGFAALRLGDTERSGKVFSKAFQLARMGALQPRIPPGGFLTYAFGNAVSSQMVEPPELPEVGGNEGVENVIQSSVGAFIDNLRVSPENDQEYLIQRLERAVETDFVETFDWLPEDKYYVPYELIGILRFLKEDYRKAINVLSKISDRELSLSGAIALTMSRRETRALEDREPLGSPDDLYQRLGGERRRAFIVDELRKQIFARMMKMYDAEVSDATIGEWYAIFCAANDMSLFARREYSRTYGEYTMAALESKLAWILCMAEVSDTMARKELESLDLSGLVRFTRAGGEDYELSRVGERQPTLAWVLFEKATRALGISGREVDRLLSDRGYEFGVEFAQ